MTDEITLLPCPFCGGTEADGTIERAHGTKYVMHNEGDDCAAFRGALIPTQHWNRRASQAAPAPQKPVAWAETDHKGKVIGVSLNQYPWHPTPLYAAPATGGGAA